MAPPAGRLSWRAVGLMRASWRAARSDLAARPPRFHVKRVFSPVHHTSAEQQHEQRGSWQPSVDTDTRISDTIAELRDRYGLRTQLSDNQLVALVRAFFEGEGDTAIARRLGDLSLDKTVTRARIGLHLFRESDTTADFDVEGLRECFAAEHSSTECARQYEIAASTAHRYRRIFDAKQHAQQVDHQYYDRFQRYCTQDIDDATDFETDAAANNGLRDAIDGAGADNPQLQ